MKRSRAYLPVILAVALLVPLAAAATSIGPTNYIATHGGTVHFTTITFTQLTVYNGVWWLTGTVSGGVNVRVVGFDCGPGVVMTVQSITRDQIRYTVTGTGTQYIYFNDKHPTNQIGASTMLFDPASGIATLTAPTGAAVTVYYGQASTGLIDAQNIAIALLPLLVLAIAVGDFRNDTLGQGTLMKVVLVVAVFGVMAWIFAGWGY